MIKAIPLLARTASLLAHLAEEQKNPIGFQMAGAAEAAVTYEKDDRRPCPSRRSRPAPPTTSSGWTISISAGRRPLSAANARLSTARSLRKPDPEPPRPSAAWTRSPNLPLHRKAGTPRKLHGGKPCWRASRRSARPTGPHLLDQRHDRDAELHPADPAGPRQLGDDVGAQLFGLRHFGRRDHRVDLQCRAFRCWRRARRLRPARHVPRSGGHRQHRAADGGDPAPEADCGGDDAVLRVASDRMGGRARLRSSRTPASDGCWLPANRAAASRRCGPGSKRAGARRSPRRWASATSASRCGANARSRTACISARAASSTPS